MQYTNWHKAIFLNRPNRFIAHCLLDGKQVVAHVKNTGRCRELLVPGCQVFLEHIPSPHRKTQYSLYAVTKSLCQQPQVLETCFSNTHCIDKNEGLSRSVSSLGQNSADPCHISAEHELLINMDSSAPNQVFWEQAKENIGKILPEFSPSDTSSMTPLILKREVPFSHSRFDFFVAQGEKQAYVEVKGVTLEENGVVLFPDAPTVRGEKHVYELIHAAQQGYLAYLVFIVQLSGAKYFTPNEKTHPSFGMALRKAQEQGVKLLCYDCHVSESEISFANPVPIQL